MCDAIAKCNGRKWWFEIVYYGSLQWNLFFVVKFLMEKRVVSLDKLLLLAVLRVNLCCC